MIRSPIGRSSVASLPSPLSRHTNPGAPSASALMRSRLSTKSLSCGESSGALSSATLIWASWKRDMRIFSSGMKGDEVDGTDGDGLAGRGRQDHLDDRE